MMAKKLKQMTENDQNAMVDAVRESAQQIWQAGLGAFAKAQHEGGAWFDKLVQEGAALHELTRDQEGAQPIGVAGKMSRLAEHVGKQASGSWDKIEKVFEDRVARALRSLGVPSRDEIAELRREVAELRAMVGEAAAPAPAEPAVRSPAKARAKAAAVPAPKRQPRASARQH